jgi:hypothetical protein
VKITTESIADSAFVRITHNWVPPDSLEIPLPGLRVSDSRYWKVEGIFPEGFKAKARFFYSKASLDNTFLTNSTDSLVMLFHTSPGHEWYGVPFTKIGGWNVGYLEVQNLMRGEYTLAVWDEQYVGQVEKEKDIKLHISPNPARDFCNIVTSMSSASKLSIYDSKTCLIKEFSLNAGDNLTHWDVKNETPGLYYIRLSGGNKKVDVTKKILIVR